MPPATDTHATINDLYAVEGKAELIAGRIVHLMGSGDQPSKVAFLIAMSLFDHTRTTGRGEARADGLSYAVQELTSGRESFMPDASYYLQPRPANRLRFVDGPPDFAVEVRSQYDYSPAAARAIATKRADYFEAGTLVVWDVDTVAETITVYRHDDPTAATVYARGGVAEAEPAVAGWRLAVDRIFG